MIGGSAKRRAKYATLPACPGLIGFSGSEFDLMISIGLRFTPSAGLIAAGLP